MPLSKHKRLSKPQFGAVIQRGRVILGFLVAPWVPMASISAFFAEPFGTSGQSMRMFLFVVPLAAIVSYVVTLVFALPLHVALRERGYVKLRHYLLGGLACALSLDALHFSLMALGCITGMASGTQSLTVGEDQLIVDGHRTWAWYVYEVPRVSVYAASGIGAGLVFWLIAVCGRATTTSNTAGEG